MNETLRPSTLGEILDRTAQLYRRNFWLFAGTAAMPIVLILGLMLLMLVAVPAAAYLVPGIANSGRGAGAMGAEANAIRAAVFVIAFLLVLPVYLAVYVFAIAGITQATVSTHLGRKLTIRAALKSVSPRFWTYLWYLILQGIMAGFVPAMAAVAVIGPLIYLIGQPGTGIAGGVALGFVVFVVGAAALVVIVWLALSYSMGIAVCVVEKKTAWQSLMRAMKLSQGTRGRIFVLFLLIVVLSMAVSMFGYILLVMASAVGAVLGKGSAAAVAAVAVGAVLYAVLSFGGQIVLQPVSWIALVLFYYDQRIRKEGFDIEWMMQQAQMMPGPLAAQPADGGIVSAPSAPPDIVP